jgi:uncharacterized protein YdaU (DUF1376 family)
VDDWLSGTLDLTLEQEAAYLRVCLLIYSRGGPIPDNERWLAGACRVSTRRWRALRQALVDAGKITIVDGLIHQSRCRIELEKSANFARKQRENVSKRWRKIPESSAKPLADNEMADTSVHTKPIPPQPHPHIKEEESSSSSRPEKQGNEYAFAGRMIRLTATDLERWRASYHAIPDLMAELQSLDDWCVAKDIDRRTWFHLVSGALSRKHTDRLRERAKANGVLSDSEVLG